MASPYAIKRFKVKNIRSLYDVDLEIESPTGLIRIGGRNGNGKSTAFYIGLSALLGFTQPLSVITRIEKADGTYEMKSYGMYEIENEYGVFGFRVNERKVEYYYELNDGSRDSSTMPVNNNLCVDVIRAYLGFDLDLEFKTVLNLNSGSNLNFVYTNGRSNLGYLKELVYSEDIEKLQERAIEDEKRLKQEIERIGDKIHFINAELFGIKIVDEVWIRNSIVWLDSVAETVKSIEKVKSLLIKTLQIEKRSKELNAERVKLLIGLTIYSAKCQKIKSIREQLIVNLEGHIKLSPITDQLQAIHKLDVNMKKHEILDKLIKMKECKSALNQLATTSKYYKAKSLQNKLISISIYSKYTMDLTIKLKNLNKINTYTLILKRKYEKAFLIDFVSNLSKQRLVYLKNSSERFRGLSSKILYLFNKQQDNKKINKELDDKIYQDGRCILCYSVKSTKEE